jgi:hypothetical protein
MATSFLNNNFDATSSSTEVESDGCSSIQQHSSEEEDTIVVSSQYAPYADEPLAPSSNCDDDGDTHADLYDNERQDLDGLTPETLAARQDGDICLDSW